MTQPDLALARTPARPDRSDSRRAPADLVDRFWILSAEESLARQGTGKSGLSTREAARRMAEVGRNIAVDPTRRRLIAKIGKRLVQPLIVILNLAAVISGATGD